MEWHYVLVAAFFAIGISAYPGYNLVVRYGPRARISLPTIRMPKFSMPKIKISDSNGSNLEQALGF